MQRAPNTTFKVKTSGRQLDTGIWNPGEEAGTGDPYQHPDVN